MTAPPSIRLPECAPPHVTLRLASRSRPRQNLLEFESDPGIRVGHVTDLQALTGCTVILPD